MTHRLERRHGDSNSSHLVCMLGYSETLGVNIPNTSAGHTFKAWLDAFNRGDRATVEKYLKTYDPERSLDDEMRFRDMTGGFILTQILKSDPQRIEFMAKESLNRYSRRRSLRRCFQGQALR
jgi:hypothetical protein